MALESAEIRMVRTTRVTGRMTVNMVLAKKSIRKGPSTRVNTTWESKKAKVSTLTQMDQPTKVAGFKIKCMDMAYSYH